MRWKVGINKKWASSFLFLERKEGKLYSERKSMFNKRRVTWNNYWTQDCPSHLQHQRDEYKKVSLFTFQLLLLPSASVKRLAQQFPSWEMPLISSTFQGWKSSYNTVTYNYNYQPKETTKGTCSLLRPYIMVFSLYPIRK